MNCKTVWLEKEQIYQTTKSYFWGFCNIVSDSVGSFVLRILKIPVFSKTNTKCCIIRLCGILIYYKDLRPKLIEKIIRDVDKKYDDIFLIRYNIGETTVILSYVDQLLKFYNSKKPVFIVFRKKDIPFYSMYLKPKKIPFVLIELSGRDIYEIYDLNDKPKTIGTRRFIAPIAKISEQMMHIINRKQETNFFDFILNSINCPRSDPMFFPKPSKQSILNIKKLNLSNTIILCPEATSVQELPTDFWQYLANRLTSKGYTVFVNAFKNTNTIKNTYSAKLKLDDLYALSKTAVGIITMANGIAIMMSENSKMDIIYTSYHGNWFGYNSTNTLRTYSVKHIPGIGANIQEYDMSDFCLEQLANQILKRY